VAKHSKANTPLPEKFTLSDLERVEFARQIATKKWLDARLELAQRDFNDGLRVLFENTDAWAQRLARRLGINKDAITGYAIGDDGVCKLKQNDPPAVE
jgi:hypothetical protein